MRVLGVIPARGGSKGVPRKNVRLLAGKPLIQYTIECALAAKRLARTVVSTDDPEIAVIAEAAGLRIPFLRPPDLARDDTPMLPVVQHAIAELEMLGERYDAICLLQPTNPFRVPDDVDGCIGMLEDAKADAVVTVLPVPAEYNPHWVYFKNADGTLRLSLGGSTPIARRQDLPETFHREGSVYVTRRDVVMERSSLYGAMLLGYPIDPARSVNIDTTEDWERAEWLAARRGV